MANYLTMQDVIMDEVKRPDLRTQVKRAIQSAILGYKDEAFAEAETFTATPISGVEDQREYDLPTDFSTPVDARLLDGSINDPLLTKSIETINELDSAENQPGGRPQYIAYYGSQFHVWPRPQSTDYSFKLYYNSSLEPPSDDADEGFWMNEAESLVRYKAKSKLYSDVLKDYARGEAEGKLADAEWLRLIGKVTARAFHGGVTKHL